MTNVILATITGYCACNICTKGLNRTASGTVPSPAWTIAVPRMVPLGSTVIIDKHIYKAEDRTAKRFDGRFDIYFSNHAAAKRFGRQTNTVTIITP